jgi:hypothetical protein
MHRVCTGRRCAPRYSRGVQYRLGRSGTGVILLPKIWKIGKIWILEISRAAAAAAACIGPNSFARDLEISWYRYLESFGIDASMPR